MLVFNVIIIKHLFDFCIVNLRKLFCQLKKSGGREIRRYNHRQN